MPRPRERSTASATYRGWNRAWRASSFHEAPSENRGDLRRHALELAGLPCASLAGRPRSQELPKAFEVANALSQHGLVDVLAGEGPPVPGVVPDLGLDLDDG